MAQREVTIHPQVSVNEHGEVVLVTVLSYDPKYIYPEAVPYGGYADESGLHIWLPPIKLNIEYDPEMIDAKALGIIRASKEKEARKYSAIATKLQFLENAFLRIGAPEVIDAPPKPASATLRSSDDEDDIPF